MDRLQLPVSQTHVDVVSMDRLLVWLAEPNKQRRLLVGHNLHSLYLCERSRAFRDLYRRADVVLADGFPVWMMARRASDIHLQDTTLEGSNFPRIGSTDWLARLDRLSRPLRIAVVGAEAASNREAVRRLSLEFPRHVFAGWDGFEDRTELERSEFRELDSFRPDLVLVGMGMPFQEEWLELHWGRLPAATYAVVGGAVDQVSGDQKLAPRWLGRFGIEWVWRLLSDPRRLAGRYLVEPFQLAFVLSKKRLSSRSRAPRNQN